MAGQNQNSQNQIPGTLRTLKTDLASVNSNPQDRLQQAGNFVQARPTNIENNTVDLKANTASSVSVEKRDMPAVEPKPKIDSDYSWSNMTPSLATNNSTLTPKTTTLAEPKSGFSVLDDSIDLPLENSSTSTNSSSNLSSDTITNQSTPPITPVTKIDNNVQTTQFDINSLNLQDDIKDIKPKKSSTKGLISVLVVVLLLGLIGGGVYFYFNMSSDTTNNITTDSDNNDSTDDTIDTDDTIVNPIFDSPLEQDSAIDIAFNDVEPIRRTISTVLTDKNDTLIQLNLTKDNNPVSLIDITDIMSLTIPSIGAIEDYRFYAYNQQGVYKLVAVLGLSSGQDAKTFVENWSNSIPRDLSGFSINLPSRIVNSPEIKKSIITNNSGKVFENYYYNYTSPSDSIDVSSYENFVLMASSQDSMRYILNQIR